MPEREFYCWQVRLFTFRLALDVVDRLARDLWPPGARPAEEKRGLLFGHFLADNNIEITDFELGHGRRIGPSDAEPVGCFRTHLRPGLSLDQNDFSLMTNAFGDRPAIGLAIRANPPGPAEAGMVFRENGDREPREPEWIFPFDVEALRIQGPIEIWTEAPATGSAWGWASELMPRPGSLLWGLVCGVAGGVLAFAVLSGLNGRERGQPAVSAPSAGLTQSSSAGPSPPTEQQGSQVFLAPPASFSDGPPDAGEPYSADADLTAKQSPFDRPEHKVTPKAHRRTNAGDEDDEQAPRSRKDTADTQESAAFVPSAPTLTPAPVASLPEPLSTPIAPLSATPPPGRAVTVDVSVEPKQEWMLKRIARRVPSLAGDVPLLGRVLPFRHDNDEDLVSPRPDDDIKPRVPADVSRHIEEPVAVDVEASIDSRGVVKDTQVKKGEDAELRALAEDAVRSAAWQPARSGNRNVAMDVVVHFRFNPNREP